MSLGHPNPPRVVRNDDQGYKIVRYYVWREKIITFGGFALLLLGCLAFAVWGIGSLYYAAFESESVAMGIGATMCFIMAFIPMYYAAFFFGHVVFELFSSEKERISGLLLPMDVYQYNNHPDHEDGKADYLNRVRGKYPAAERLIKAVESEGRQLTHFEFDSIRFAVQEEEEKEFNKKVAAISPGT